MKSMITFLALAGCIGAWLQKDLHYLPLAASKKMQPNLKLNPVHTETVVQNES